MHFSCEKLNISKHVHLVGERSTIENSTSYQLSHAYFLDHFLGMSSFRRAKNRKN